MLETLIVCFQTTTWEVFIGNHNIQYFNEQMLYVPLKSSCFFDFFSFAL